MTSPAADDRLGPPSPSPSPSLARKARLITVALLVAILGVSLAEAEEWPLSAFRLFSGTRSGESIGWQLVAVDDGGAEHVVDLSDLPARYGLVHHLLPELSGRSPAEQRAEIRSWLQAVDVDVDGISSARVYRVVSTVPKTADGARDVVSRVAVTDVPLT